MWARPWENVYYAICEQQRRSSACASAQSDQCLCCSLPKQNDTSSLRIRNFKILAGLCSWAGQFVSWLVGDSWKHIFSWCGSCVTNKLVIPILQKHNWTASSEFGTYRLCEQRRFRRACASAQSRQNLRCSLIQAMSQEEPWDRKPDPWPLWMAGHAQ